MQKAPIMLSRTTAFTVVLLFLAAMLLPSLLMGRASAGIPTSRSITMSSSQGGATDVTYTLAFTTDQGGSASNIGGMVVEFCDNTPIIGDSTCTAPSGFASGAPTTTTLVLANQTNITGWSIDGTNSTANRIVLTRTAASVNSGVNFSIDFGSTGGSDGVTNPTQGNHTFYARVLTYATGAGAQGYTPASPGSYVDAGGIALSTANQLQITAKVQERLTFCVYTGGSCTANTTGAARTSSINLGNTNGVLDPAGPFVDKNAKFDISTNALSGAAVVFKGDVPKTGAFEITSTASSGTGASATTAYASSAGNEQFGFCAFQSVAGSSNLTFSAPYNDATCDAQTGQSSGTGTPGQAGTATFGFNRTAATSASGSALASKPAGTASTATLAFMGNISNTTEAGIYQTTLTFVATGTY